MAKKNLFSVAHNPDVLSCLANLSNDEVFTPPDIANMMLDTLPQEIFQNKSTTFLDPACKSGVFLREIAKRLLVGIKDKIPDLRKRVDHIFHNQLFGLSITELTSLLSRRSVYCSKYPNSEYSVTVFDNPEGNIRFKKNEHVWRDDNCAFCGASKSVYDRDDALEFHAYEFIHTINPDEIFKMKFDVIVGNPPYQLTDSGHGKSAIPIYQHFVQQAIRLNPRYLVMIIPSRWFSGGKGLDNFRSDMLKDKHIRKLVDYENFRDVFPGVDLAGGACYFLRNRDEEGSCSVTNFYNGNKVSSERYLNEFDTFIRQNLAIDIVRKIRSIHGGGKFLDEVASSRKPFGLPTNYEPKEKGIPCWFIQRIGLKYASANDVADTNKYLNKWKLLLPIAPIAGQTDFTKPVGFYYDGNTIISKPGECCTESYFVANAFNSKAEVLSFKSYIFTKTARFLLLQAVVSQHVTKKNFCFVPDIGSYTSIFSDEMLRKKWKITDAEWDFIDSKISTIGGVANE